MTEASGRFALPWIVSGQAQKEVTHNEALALIDMLLHPAVATLGLAVAPADPAIGAAWVVGRGAGGAWSGQDDRIATWTDGGWRFAAPVRGMLAWVADRGLHAHWTGESWRAGPFPTAGIACDGLRVVGPRQPAIAAAAGGATVDAEARATVRAILDALRAHGLIAT